jgi:hypothetical protein
MLDQRLALLSMPRLKMIEQAKPNVSWAAPPLQAFTILLIAAFDLCQGSKIVTDFWGKVAEVNLSLYH